MKYYNLCEDKNDLEKSEPRQVHGAPHAGSYQSISAYKNYIKFEKKQYCKAEEILGTSAFNCSFSLFANINCQKLTLKIIFKSRKNLNNKLTFVINIYLEPVLGNRKWKCM